MTTQNTESSMKNFIDEATENTSSMLISNVEILNDIDKISNHMQLDEDTILVNPPQEKTDLSKMTELEIRNYVNSLSQEELQKLQNMQFDSRVLGFKPLRSGGSNYTPSKKTKKIKRKISKNSKKNNR